MQTFIVHMHMHCAKLLPQFNHYRLSMMILFNPAEPLVVKHAFSHRNEEYEACLSHIAHSHGTTNVYHRIVNLHFVTGSVQIAKIICTYFLPILRGTE